MKLNMKYSDNYHRVRISRNVLGTKTLCGILSERDSIATDMQTTLDEATEPWGVKVERVEVKDVRLPKNLQRAMAAEAEATREAQAKIIAAEGEHKASRSLKHAAEVLGDSHAAMQVKWVKGSAALISGLPLIASISPNSEHYLRREEQHHSVPCSCGSDESINVQKIE